MSVDLLDRARLRITVGSLLVLKQLTQRSSNKLYAFILEPFVLGR